MDVAAAVEAIRLGASMRELFDEFLMTRLEAPDHEELRRVLNGLTLERRRGLREEAQRFTGMVCRLIGERFGSDTRMCHVLLEWVRTNKDYEAFDALLTGFEFASREQVLAEGKRLFPATLTAHW